MKKILFVMLMFLFTGLASPLFALEPIQPQSVGCDVKAQWVEGVDIIKTSVSDKAITISAVAQPPTSSLSQLEEKLDKMISGCRGETDPTWSTTVVCNLRGESGV